MQAYLVVFIVIDATASNKGVTISLSPTSSD